MLTGDYNLVCIGEFVFSPKQSDKTRMGWLLVIKSLAMASSMGLSL